MPKPETKMPKPEQQEPINNKIEAQMIEAMTRPQAEDTVRFDASKFVRYPLGVMSPSDFRTLFQELTARVSCREEDGPDINTLYSLSIYNYVLGFFGCRVSDQREGRGINIDGVILDYDVPFTFVRELARKLPSEVCEVILNGQPALRLSWD